jgi:hypothetical protein
LLRRITIAILLCACVSAQVNTQERKVRGNVITSDRDPAVRITLPKSVQYVGAYHFVLYAMADCELHAFVEADELKNVQRLYWIQFEGYLPSRPELKHTYDSPQHTQLAGMDFYVDTWARATDAATTPGSDLEHIQTLIRAKGYRLPAATMSVRLVHLVDESKRRELMIIYSEDLAPTGFSAADLQKDGRANGRWPAITQDLIRRAEDQVHLENLGGSVK